MMVNTFIVTSRGLLEMVLWLMVGRTVLAILAGRYGSDNAVILMFDFLLRPIRICSARLMPALSVSKRDRLSFVLLLVIWLMLGFAKVRLAVA